MRLQGSARSPTLRVRFMDLVYVPSKMCVLRARRYGSLDAKSASLSSFPSLQFSAIAGPTTGGGKYPPFAWSTTDLEDKDIPDFQPFDAFNFEPIKHTWRLNANDAR